MLPANPKMPSVSLELSSPVDPSKIPNYYDRLTSLFQYTNKISLASHPIGNGRLTISGFDRNYNFAKYMLERWPYFNILFHLTCFDLNRVNIDYRLNLLKDINIDEILLVTGDSYQQPESSQKLYFNNSEELIKFIHHNYGYRFKVIAVAGYPSHVNDTDSLKSIKAKVSYGATAIYTQCLFDWVSYESYKKRLEDELDDMRHLDIIPSIALFKDLATLNRVVSLSGLRVEANGLKQAIEIHQEREDIMLTESINFVIRLCAEFMTRRPNGLINLCLFGLVDLAYVIISRNN